MWLLIGLQQQAMVGMSAITPTALSGAHHLPLWYLLSGTTLCVSELWNWHGCREASGPGVPMQVHHPPHQVWAVCTLNVNHLELGQQSCWSPLDEGLAADQLELQLHKCSHHPPSLPVVQYNGYRSTFSLSGVLHDKTLPLLNSWLVSIMGLSVRRP